MPWPCPVLNLSPEAGGCSGSGSTDEGARAVLRCSSALFPKPSSLLLSFGLFAFPLCPGFAIQVASLVRRCPGCLSLPSCSQVATLLCASADTFKLCPKLCHSLFSSAGSFLAFPPWMMDGGAGTRASGGASACPAWPGFVMCQGGVQLQS